MGVKDPHPQQHETRDMEFFVVLKFLIALFASLLLVHFASALLYRRFQSHPGNQLAPSPLAGTRQPASGPRLLVNQYLDMDELRATEEATLNSYGWIDRSQGQVRIPIDRAMELLAERRGGMNASRESGNQ